MASVRKRTIPTERPPLFSEVSANFLRIDGAITEDNIKLDLWKQG
jgi:hypothetical protein